MSHYLDELTFSLEKHMMSSEKWEGHLHHFPDDVRKELEYNMRWQNGLEKDMPHPIGIGYREDVGWFCLGSGQGPFIIWKKK